MAWNDLINSTRAGYNLPANPNNTVVSALITAVSVAITRYTKRQLVSQTYDELYNGNGNRQLQLRNYPILSVQSVRYRPVTVLKITNNLLANVQARVSVTATGLQLVSTNAGVQTTVTSGLSFAGNVDLNALTAAVNAVGNGWAAQVVGDSTNYGGWPSADLYCPNGVSGTNDPGVEGQGALQCVAGSFAELKMHTYELQGWQPETRQGWLLRAIPYTDPELLHPEDLIWPMGVNNFRIQYTAGYAAIPDDVQEAAAEWVSILYNLTQRDPSLLHQVPVNGTTSGWGALVSGATGSRPPAPVKALLAGYRKHTLSHSGG
jgi:hypothetical protein